LQNSQNKRHAKISGFTVPRPGQVSTISKTNCVCSMVVNG